MITRARAFAKSIVDKGYNVVPLFPNSKETNDKNWQLKKYKVDDFLDDSNVGINLGLSNLIDVDLDCDLALHFGNKYLPHNTLMLKRVHPNGKSEITHFFFENNGILKDNDVKKFRGETITDTFTTNSQFQWRRGPTVVASFTYRLNQSKRQQRRRSSGRRRRPSCVSPP